MRKVLIMMFVTLDGVAEFPDLAGEASEDADAEEDEPMWGPRMDSIDTLLLGRRSYEKWAAFWPSRKSDPSSGPFQKRFSEFADRAEKVVFSGTLKSATWSNSRVVRGDVAEEVARLRALPGKDMAVGGGPRLAQSFLERDLADEVLLEMFPSIVGRGKPLFRVESDPNHDADVVPAGAPGRHDFRLIEARPLKDGTVFLHYTRVGPKRSFEK